MSEFIGARISLISKSNIRYVGTLVEINSEQSTVSLDNVRSFGTEGRNGGKDEYGPSEAVYSQIVFRGSDVKDLRIEETAKDKPAPPPMPNDPAIIGVPQQQPSQPRENAQADQQRPPPQPQQQQQQAPPPNFPPPGQFPPGYPPYGGPFQNRFGPGPQGFPGPGGPPGPFPNGPNGYGMPPFGAPPGAPPGWFPPGPGFAGPPGPFPQGPIGPPGQHQQNQNQAPQGSRGPGAPAGPPVNQEAKPNVQPKVVEADGAAKPVGAGAAKPIPTSSTPAEASHAPPPPVESKPDVAAALAPPPAQPSRRAGASATTPGAKSNRIVPAVPLASPSVSKTVPHAASAAPQPSAAAPISQVDATQAATAAVAAAMAKLNLQSGKGPVQNRRSERPTDNLTQKVNEMRADDQIRHGTQPGTGGFASGFRGGRGGRGRGGPSHAKIEVPTTDFDFAFSNAKFNKQDLLKEAIASGSPLGDVASTPETVANGHAGAAEEGDVVIPSGGMYDKGTSFFDNISSELKDRTEAANRRGQEFRTEERKKNMETFGQGSVDGFRGGYRGRGRGRGRGRPGFGYRGRGVPRGRGGPQGVPEAFQ